MEQSERWRRDSEGGSGQEIQMEALAAVNQRESSQKSFGRAGNGTPLQCSCLENPTDRGAWWAAVHGVAKSPTRLSDFTFTFHFHALEKEMATHSSVLPGESQGRRSLVGCRLRGRTESDTTEVTQQQQQQSPLEVNRKSLDFSWLRAWHSAILCGYFTKGDSKMAEDFSPLKHKAYSSLYRSFQEIKIGKTMKEIKLFCH